MKRQKRNRDDRAYNRGYMAGINGKSREDCPFGTLQGRTHWMGGWREGRTDQAQGFLGIAGIQNLKDIG
ncbi:ribosome modulation factor [Alcanivorax hongdengensis]|nr:ribosome modulation factor [Alcanivorax hongdengensis]